MKAQDFAALECALSQNARGIVGRILAQPRSAALAPWEERFLEQRIFTLELPTLASWLAHRPRDVRLVIEAIVALAPKRDSLAAWHLQQHAEAIGEENWTLLAKRLQPMISVPDWSHALASVDAQSVSARPMTECEGACAIGWLGKHGVASRELMSLALDGITAPEVSEATLDEIIFWLAQRLVTRSAWELHGEAVLYRFHVRWGWDLLGPLFQLLHYAVERSRDLAFGPSKPAELARGLWSLGAPPAWAPALHESLARLIIRIAREALERGEHARARATLTALLQLNPPPRVVPQLHRLLDLRQLGQDIRELVELNVHLLRRENGRAASLAGVLNALQELPMS